MAEPIWVPVEDTGPTLNVVEWDTAEGLALIVYGPGPGYVVEDVCFVPAAELGRDE